MVDFEHLLEEFEPKDKDIQLKDDEQPKALQKHYKKHRTRHKIKSKNYDPNIVEQNA